MAHRYEATVKWNRNGEDFLDRKYSRGHAWRFDGGVEVPASASPQVVKPPYSREDAVDPEEALVASTSSCHMLFFVDLASHAGFRIDSYVDEAFGVMDKRADGRTAMTEIVLRPAVAFSGDKQPTAEEIAELHHRAHELCFIANTLNCEVRVDAPAPTFA
ncbi:MAG: OsmC family protein [Maricaulaceae bacterium]|jgi:organic hydroperoxide reductase OsmC/OhrA